MSADPLAGVPADAILRFGLDDPELLPPIEPPTLPRGMPIIPPRPPPACPGRRPDARAAAALAAAFAADYLSWDEGDPLRRGQALHRYLPGHEPGDLVYLVWNGQGRQRAECPLAGRSRTDGEDRLLVDVRSRIVADCRSSDVRRDIGAPASSRCRSTEQVASAPPLHSWGWKYLPAKWGRLTVPIVTDVDGEQHVDVGDELLDVPPTPG